MSMMGSILAYISPLVGIIGVPLSIIVGITILLAFFCLIITLWNFLIGHRNKSRRYPFTETYLEIECFPVTIKLINDGNYPLTTSNNLCIIPYGKYKTKDYHEKNQKREVYSQAI